MNTINKKTYQQPNLERISLDKEISLTLDSSLLPMGDPEAMIFGSETIMSEPLGL